MKCWTGWITSWNQDCWEEYQQPHICRWHHSSGRKWRGTKESLDEGVRGEWKSWLKTQHSKNKIMASIPSNSWQIEGEKVDAMTDFIFLVSQITADGDCSHEIKRCLLLVRKAMTNLDSILKSKDHFADKGSYSQSYGFSSSVQLLSCVRLFVTPWTAAQ